MKKLIYIISVTFFILQACSSSGSSSDTINGNNSLLFRRWYFVSETFKGITYYPVICENNSHRDYIDFLSSNIANFYHVESSTNNNCSDDYALEPYEWVKNGDVIKLTYTRGTYVSTIVISELTATTFKFVETNAVTRDSSLKVYSAY